LFELLSSINELICISKNTVKNRADLAGLNDTEKSIMILRQDRNVIKL